MANPPLKRKNTTNGVFKLLIRQKMLKKGVVVTCSWDHRFKSMVGTMQSPLTTSVGYGLEGEGPMNPDAQYLTVLKIFS